MLSAMGSEGDWSEQQRCYRRFLHHRARWKKLLLRQQRSSLDGEDEGSAGEGSEKLLQRQESDDQYSKSPGGTVRRLRRQRSSRSHSKQLHRRPSGFDEYNGRGLREIAEQTLERWAPKTLDADGE